MNDRKNSTSTSSPSPSPPKGRRSTSGKKNADGTDKPPGGCVTM